METVYTVLESEGHVEICVNLTRPEMDILDETIRVNSYNNESSVYIPPNAVLASKPSITSIYLSYISLLFS